MLTGVEDRVVLFDVAAQDGHLGGHDVTLYDLAALFDTETNDLRHLLATNVPVVGLEPAGRSDLSDCAVYLGVAAIVTMSVTRAALIGALERAAAGETIDLDKVRHEHRRALMAEYGLIEREVQMLDLIAAGRSNTEIAGELYLSVNTVKTYIRSAYRRIGAKTRSQAVLWASDHGLAGHPDRPERPTFPD